MQSIDENEIPEAAHVSCPALSSAVVSVRETCAQCQFCRAVVNVNPDTRIPWAQQHNIVCQFPRRLPVVERVGAESAQQEINGRTVVRVLSDA